MRVRSALVTGVCLTAISMMITAPAAAQDQAGDVAFSYTVMHDSDVDETFPAGWSVAVNGHLNSVFGVVGEVGGHYKTVDLFGTELNARVHTLMGGARIRQESSKTVPFAQVLVGMARIGVSFLDESDDVTEFAVQPGGGVDFRLTDRFGIRVQGDYRIIGNDETINEFRFAVGGILGFGHR